MTKATCENHVTPFMKVSDAKNIFGVPVAALSYSIAEHPSALHIVTNNAGRQHSKCQGGQSAKNGRMPT